MGVTWQNRRHSHNLTRGESRCHERDFLNVIKVRRFLKINSNRKDTLVCGVRVTMTREGGGKTTFHKVRAQADDDDGEKPQTWLGHERTNGLEKCHPRGAGIVTFLCQPPPTSRLRLPCLKCWLFTLRRGVARV